jgi:hypothetical protein
LNPRFEYNYDRTSNDRNQTQLCLGLNACRLDFMGIYICKTVLVDSYCDKVVVEAKRFELTSLLRLHSIRFLLELGQAGSGFRSELR